MKDFKRIRELNLISKKKISNHMYRLTFNSNDLHDFSDNEAGGYVKLIFPQQIPNSNTYLVRPYTIRNFRKEKLEIDIDFVVHNEKKGLASCWALKADVGDKIKISGPGPKQKINDSLDWYFFIGDMSALPAISVNLEMLSPSSRGIIVLEVLSESDKIKIHKPKNFSICWVINPNKETANKLYKKVKSIKWLRGKPFIWSACEFSDMKLLRQYFKNIGVEKENIYISSYWKKNSDQEEHKLLKKQDNINWLKS